MTRYAWKQTVRIGDFWHDENLSLAEKARKITQRMSIVGDQLSGFAQQDLLDLMFVLTDAARADEVDEFDRVWSDVYDWADEHRVWIDTAAPKRTGGAA